MLRSDLNHFPFAAVLQMLMNGSKSGHARLSGPLEGELWLDGGALVHAAALGRVGAAAMDLLASVTGGELRFESGGVAPVRSVTAHRDATLRQLLVDGDAWGRLSLASPEWTLPEWDRPLVFTARWSDQQPVTRLQYRALSGVGRLTVRQTLAAQPDMPPRTLLGILNAFRQAGLIDLGTRTP